MSKVPKHIKMMAIEFVHLIGQNPYDVCGNGVIRWEQRVRDAEILYKMAHIVPQEPSQSVPGNSCPNRPENVAARVTALESLIKDTKAKVDALWFASTGFSTKSGEIT